MDRTQYRILVQDLLKKKTQERGRTITLEEMSQETGISRSTVSALIGGPTEGVTFISMVRFAHWLNIPLHEIVEALGILKEKSPRT
jgi:transcriptional regulator with XRE-family HTH domain